MLESMSRRAGGDSREAAMIIALEMIGAEVRPSIFAVFR